MGVWRGQLVLDEINTTGRCHLTLCTLVGRRESLLMHRNIYSTHANYYSITRARARETVHSYNRLDGMSALGATRDGRYDG